MVRIVWKVSGATNLVRTERSVARPFVKFVLMATYICPSRLIPATGTSIGAIVTPVGCTAMYLPPFVRKSR